MDESSKHFEGGKMIHIIFLILMALGTDAFGQGPSARMVDEFRTAGNNCEEGFARLDSYFVELENNPMDEGLIVISGDELDATAARRREQQLLNHFTFRKFDRTRVRVIRAAARTNATTQFWLVPPGADMPEIELDRRGVVAEPIRPYLYAANYADGVPGCFGNLYDVGEFAKVVRADDGNTARIVINESSRIRYRRTAREITAELASLGIQRSRVATVYKYVRPNRLLEVTELWVIPSKRRLPTSANADLELGLIHRCPSKITSWLRGC
jgi:hypothetical protein